MAAVGRLVVVMVSSSAEADCKDDDGEDDGCRGEYNKRHYEPRLYTD